MEDNVLRKKINELIDFIPVEDDCQRKFDIDGSILEISSRGYDEKDKSIYVGYYISSCEKGDYSEGNFELFEGGIILKDELHGETKEELIVNARQWYKDNFARALMLVLEQYTGKKVLLKGE